MIKEETVLSRGEHPGCRVDSPAVEEECKVQGEDGRKGWGEDGERRGWGSESSGHRRKTLDFSVDVLTKSLSLLSSPLPSAAGPITTETLSVRHPSQVLHARQFWHSRLLLPRWCYVCISAGALAFTRHALCAAPFVTLPPARPSRQHCSVDSPPAP